ncbi:LexA repressor [Alicyclobacillus cellulosilyticus]|uniref:LexA repressor n=1 Tax=Alicyclobacillus cellulosilyticus TaxID=1003997 RepID=A0A917KIT1_9BACL|nr:transcriptional repressor LexA [Alicyclobacillus cellulosilyticus]GGJ13363.1 LexA repressor [Alicyclobacillus cellulosilyticus]
MPDLTRRQREILDFIRRTVAERGYPPSVREIGEAVGLASSSTVHGHLERLQAKGYIRRDPTKPRAIELLTGETATRPRGLHVSSPDRQDTAPDGDANEVYWAPVVGKVTAGVPITAIEHIEEFVPLPRAWVRGRELYLLRVRGDSMVNAGILDGDYVVVQKQETAQNGDIVVAMTEEGEATVKRFFREAHRVRLQPENDHMPPMYYPSVRILGKVTGVLRWFHN